MKVLIGKQQNKILIPHLSELLISQLILILMKLTIGFSFAKSLIIRILISILRMNNIKQGCYA